MIPGYIARMNKKSGGKQTGKRWVHPPSSLTNGHVVYNVKLLGHTEVDEPKGADVVREAVRKLKFNKQLKRAEGEKPPKVELTISSMGVTIQDRQTKVRLETFPLHRISYCADDKQDKRICAFICKQETTNKNICFVMDSDKCAEEITLTVGQAFDLAYQQFMQKSGKDITNQVLTLQKKVRDLETENTNLRMRVVELEAHQGIQPPPYAESTSDNTGPSSQQALHKANSFQSPMAGPHPSYSPPLTGDAATTGPHPVSPTHRAPGAGATNGVGASSPRGRQDRPSPLIIRRPRSYTLPACSAPTPTTGTTVTSRPRPHGVSAPNTPDSAVPSLAPPPSSVRPRRSTYGSTPTPGQESPGSNDPFGQAPFSQAQPLSAARSNPLLRASTGSSQDMDMIQYNEIQEGFASGLTIGNEDLSLADLDPLSNLSSC